MTEQLHPRFTLNSLLAATGGRARGFEADADSFGRIEIDSRSIRRGDLFWAIRGERFDGHAFTTSALANGAAGCVVEEAWADRIIGPRIVVADTRRALGDLAAAHREQLDALVIGITGSVGKTTTRELLHAVLSTQFDGIRSPRNYNNDLGVPLTLLQLERDHEFGIVEVGASAPGEIARLAAITRPDVAIVTRVSPAHLQGFGSLASIADEKAALVEATSESGFVVLNGDDPLVRTMARRCAGPAILVGQSRDNDLRGTIESVEFGQLLVRVDGKTYTIPASGRHHLVPVLAAIAIAREVGIAPAAIAEGLRRFEPVAGRCRVETIGPWTVVNDAYNSSPAAMGAACDLLAECPVDGPRILVVGDMLDLGAEADWYHGELGRMVADAGGGHRSERHIEHLLLLGAQAERVAHEARTAGMEAHRLAVCSDFETLTTVLDCTLAPGAVVLVKGSRAMHMERTIAWLRCRAEELDLAPVARVPARAA